MPVDGDHVAAKNMVAGLSSIGVKVEICKCDASIEADMRLLISECEKAMPPIGGVIHGAYVNKVCFPQGYWDYRVKFLIESCRMCFSNRQYTVTGLTWFATCRSSMHDWPLLYQLQPGASRLLLGHRRPLLPSSPRRRYHQGIGHRGIRSDNEAGVSTGSSLRRRSARRLGCVDREAFRRPHRPCRGNQFREIRHCVGARFFTCGGTEKLDCKGDGGGGEHH